MDQRTLLGVALLLLVVILGAVAEKSRQDDESTQDIPLEVLEEPIVEESQDLLGLEEEYISSAKKVKPTDASILFPVDSSGELNYEDIYVLNEIQDSIQQTEVTTASPEDVFEILNSTVNVSEATLAMEDFDDLPWCPEDDLVTLEVPISTTPSATIGDELQNVTMADYSEKLIHDEAVKNMTEKITGWLEEWLQSLERNLTLEKSGWSYPESDCEGIEDHSCIELGAIQDDVDSAQNAEQIPQPTTPIPQNTVQIPQCMDQLLGNTEQSPQSMDQLLGNTEQSPQSMDQLLGNTEQSPQSMDQLLGNTEQSPQSMEEILQSTTQLPQRMDEILQNTTQILLNTAQLPQIATQIPLNTMQNPKFRCRKRNTTALNPEAVQNGTFNNTADALEDEIGLGNSYPLGYGKRTPWTAVHTDGGPEFCFNDHRWLRFRDQCYYIHSDSKAPPHLLTFDEGERYCRSQQGALASIHTEEEYLFILSKIRPLEFTVVWIGLSRKRTGKFEWTDGSLTDFVKWAKGEPNNLKGLEMCADIYTAHGLWNDRNCGLKQGFICKRPLEIGKLVPNPPIPAIVTGKCQTGWTSLGQKCFKLFGNNENERLTYEEAMQQCRSMGDGHDLVSIHSQQEQDLLVGAMYHSPSHAWIGFQNLADKRVFLWSDNSDVTYLNWADGQPTLWNNRTDNGENSSTSEQCVEIWRDPPKHHLTGRWNDQNCDNKNAYICARPAEKIATCRKPETPKYTKISSERSNIDNIHVWSPPTGYFETGITLRYRCISDFYQLEGNPTRDCLNTGEWSGAQPRCVPVCGLPKDPKNPLIVFGKVSNVGDWPWQVAIRDLTKTNKYLICGGTVIDDEWVLTAAHCVTEENRNTVRRASELELYYGKHYYGLDKDDQHVMKTEVQQIVVHDQYSPRTLDYDIALIRSRRSIEFNDRIRPACLPDPSRGFRTRIANRNKGIVSGWGTTEQANPAMELKYAVLEVVSNSECQRLLNNIPGNEPSDPAQVDEPDRQPTSPPQQKPRPKPKPVIPATTEAATGAIQQIGGILGSVVGTLVGKPTEKPKAQSANQRNRKTTPAPQRWEEEEEVTPPQNKRRGGLLGILGRRKRQTNSAHTKVSMTRNMYCAGSESGWACSGDSGGPMVMNHAPHGDQPRWVVEGIVSWGQTFCHSNRSAYTRVENFLSWIHKYTGE